MKLELVRQALYSQPWAITPDGLALLELIVEAHAQGLEGDVEQALNLRAERDYRASQALQQATGKGVAVIPIHGSIINRWAGFMGMSSGAISPQAVSKAIRASADDPGIGEIILDMDSPGGTVAGTEVAADAVRYASSKKPVLAVANGSGAFSAAYWIAAQASKIILPRTAGVGSISVILSHRDISQAQANAGVKTTYLRTGSEKALGQIEEPLTKEIKEKLMAEMQRYHDEFVAAVNAGRGSRISVKAYDSGRIWIGQDAVNAGMADELGSLEDVIVGAVSRASKSVYASQPQPQYLIFNGATSGLVPVMQFGEHGAPQPGAEALPVALTKKGNTKMTLEELKAQHPDLYASVLQEGERSGEAKARASTALAFGISDPAQLDPAKLSAQAKDGIAYRESLEKRLLEACVAVHGQEGGATIATRYTKAFKGLEASELLAQVETLEAQRDAMVPNGRASVDDPDGKKTKKKSNVSKMW